MSAGKVKMIRLMLRANFYATAIGGLKIAMFGDAMILMLAR
jgi:hypothetical protein